MEAVLYRATACPCFLFDTAFFALQSRRRYAAEPAEYRVAYASFRPDFASEYSWIRKTSRQQLAILNRQLRRPKFRLSDQFFWLLLFRSWRSWKETLLIVKLDTILRWHRKRFASYGTRLSWSGGPNDPHHRAAGLAFPFKICHPPPLRCMQWLCRSRYSPPCQSNSCGGAPCHFTRSERTRTVQ